MGKIVTKPTPGRTSGFAIASLILGIFSVILGWIPFFGWVFVILTLVLGILALIKIKKEGLSGRGLTIAGLILGSIGLLLAVIVMIVFLTDVEKGFSCTDMNCFISNANQCKATTYEEATDFGEISYSIKPGSTGNCILTKEVVELSENEDAALKEAIEGKKMECAYSPGQFNGQWTSSLIEGLEDCQGELKEVIGQLLLLV